LTVSGLSVWRLGTVFVAALITIKRFQSSAPKAQNGFVAGRIVSSPVVRRHISRRCKQFQWLATAFNDRSRPAQALSGTQRAGYGGRITRQGRLFYFFLVENNVPRAGTL